MSALDSQPAASPVLDDACAVMVEADHVSIDDDALAELADALAAEYDFEVPAWDAPVFPETDAPTADIVDFFIVGNALNYCFNDIETGEKYAVDYIGTEWAGAFGMWAALKREYDERPDILSADRLSSLTREEVEDIFAPAGDTPLPLLDTRVENLRAVGDLMDDAGGTFAPWFEGEVSIYGEDGVVSRLVESAAYRDERKYEGCPVRFDKRAQLAVCMLYGKLRGTDAEFRIVDLDEFTVFADYGIPAGLAAQGVIEYDEALEQAIEAGETIPENSNEEVEIRAATVVAGNELLRELNSASRPEAGEKVAIPELDYVLWQMRNDADTVAHITPTTAY